MSFDALLLLLLPVLLLLFEVLLLVLLEFEMFSLLADEIPLFMVVLDDIVFMAPVEFDEELFEFNAELDVDVGKIFVSFISTLTNQYKLRATTSF